MEPKNYRLLTEAFNRRQELLEQFAQENTNCFRLLHGTVEGIPGLTVDKYGEQLLIQSFYSTPKDNEVEVMIEFYSQHFKDIKCAYFHDKSRKGQHKYSRTLTWGDKSPLISEVGLNLNGDLSFNSQDPLLFLDFRSARRAIIDIASNATVLNTFCYTGAIGLQALKHGAHSLTQLDFSTFALIKAKENAALNGLDEKTIRYIHDDFFVVSRQFAGLPVGGRIKKRFKPYDAASFDIVILDPPRYAKTPFGTVDLVKDYQSLLKPCLYAVNPGGYLLCTNNVASIDIDEWINLVKACCEKNRRKIDQLEIIKPDADFPSFDNRPPLKTLLIKLD